MFQKIWYVFVIVVWLAFLGVVGVVWIESWLEPPTEDYQETSTSPGGSLAVQTNEQAKIWKEKWLRKYQEQDARGFTTGTIDEYWAERHQDFKVVYQTPTILAFSTPKNPYKVFVVFQVRSIQGRDLLLLSSSYGTSDLSPEAILAEWKVQEPGIQFDETKHYAGYYRDCWNNSPMFVIWERWPGQESIPIQALFYRRNVEVPRLVDKASNSKWCMGRGSHTFPDIQLKRAWNRLKKGLEGWLQDK